MITVKRDNTKVIVAFGTDLAHSCDGTEKSLIPFEWSTPHPYIADLLCRYITRRFFDAVAEARQEAYEQGWKDAKARKAKETWFSGEL